MNSNTGQQVVFNGTTAELLAVQSGQSLEEYRAERDFKDALSTESAQYVDLPACKWPKLKFNWDLSTDSQRFALDGVSESEFASSYPDGFVHAWVRLDEFDAHLCHQSKRETEEELWGLGSKSKLAFLIAYLRCEHPITPPLVALTDSNEFVFQGGNHRYAIAKAIRTHSLPVYMQSHTYSKAAAIVTLTNAGAKTP